MSWYGLSCRWQQTHTKRLCLSEQIITIAPRLVLWPHIIYRMTILAMAWWLSLCHWAVTVCNGVLSWAHYVLASINNKSTDSIFPCEKKSLIGHYSCIYLMRLRCVELVRYIGRSPITYCFAAVLNKQEESRSIYFIISLYGKRLSCCLMCSVTGSKDCSPPPPQLMAFLDTYLTHYCPHPFASLYSSWSPMGLIRLYDVT